MPDEREYIYIVVWHIRETRDLSHSLLIITAHAVDACQLSFATVNSDNRTKAYIYTMVYPTQIHRIYR